jgi:hypothetical protein
MTLSDAIRLFCDQANRSNVLDLNTTLTPVFYRGDDVEIDIGIGQSGNLLTSLSNVASVTAQIFQSETDPSPAMMACTVLAASMHLACTQAAWTAGTDAHAAFIWPNSLTAITLNGQPSQNYWLRITALTTDATPKNYTLLDGEIVVKDGPISTASAPLPPSEKFVTIAGVSWRAVLCPDGLYRVWQPVIEGSVLTAGWSDQTY